MLNEDAILRGLFEGHPIIPSDKHSNSNNNGGGDSNSGVPATASVAMPLTDFHPKPLHYADVYHIARLMYEAVPSRTWEQVSTIVGVADRSAGSVLHVLASIAGLPYSLANWFPKGSRGDIHVMEQENHNGVGDVLLNGVDKGATVLVADIVIRSGTMAMALVKALQKAGVNVAHAVFGADFSDRDGVKNIKRILQPERVTTVGTVMVDEHGDLLQKTTFKRNLLAARCEAPPQLYSCAATAASDQPPPASPFTRISNEVPPARPLEVLPASAVESCFRRCLSLWVGIPVYRAAGSDYPYSNFVLTDGAPAIEPARVEDIADAMVFLSPTLRKFSRRPATPAEQQEYLLVSESDRGGGPITAAVARRTNLCFTMANWSSEVEISRATTSNVGYSGAVKLFLNGIQPGQKVVLVDDMLSSGGTLEGLLKAVAQAGGVPVEAVFAAEKVTTKGRERLAKSHPGLPLISVCFFASGEHETVAVSPPRNLAHETPVQKFEDAESAGDRRQRDGEQK